MAEILVYRYGLLRPTENYEGIMHQMWLAHRYRNTLTEIERGRRAAVRDAIRSAGDIATLERQARIARENLQEANAAIKRERARKKARATSEAAKQRVAQAKEAKKIATSAFHDSKRMLLENKQIQAQLDRISELAGQINRNARAYCGAYWGTYSLVEDAMQAAKKAPLYDSDAQPNDPEFVPWKGQGSVGVQLQGGISLGELHNDTQVQIEHMPDRRGRSNSPWAMLRMRIRSEGRARSPVWGVWPMKMHRPLPHGARIKKAAVHLRKIGPREEWFVTFTLDVSAVAKPEPSTGPAVGIDVGWRAIDGEMRIASWHGADGDGAELRLSADVVSGFRKAEELLSVRDDNFEIIKARLTKWLDSASPPDHPVGGSQSEHRAAVFARAAHLPLWKSKARMARLVTFWKSSRFDGDEEIYQEMEAWRYQDHHLWAWERSQQKGSERRRNDVYRCFSKNMADRFGVAVIEQFDLRKMAKKQPAEEDKPENKKARSNRQLASVSKLRLSLVNAFRRAGSVIAMPAHDTTRECHVCGVVEVFDAEAEIRHTCPNRHRWDQDANAARNLLTRWRERPNDAMIVGSARDTKNNNENNEIKEKRWEKAKRKGNERRDRIRAARNAGCNTAKSV